MKFRVFVSDFNLLISSHYMADLSVFIQHLINRLEVKTINCEINKNYLDGYYTIRIIKPSNLVIRTAIDLADELREL